MNAVRVVNGSAIENYIIASIDAGGNKSYSIANPNAFLDALGLNTIETLTPTWNEGTAGTATLYKCGSVVTFRVVNPTKLNAGANTIFTIPEGWRPPANIVMVLIRPVGTISSGGTNLSLRVTVGANGIVTIYNYRSEAIDDETTNQSGCMTYVAVN